MNFYTDVKNFKLQCIRHDEEKVRYPLEIFCRLDVHVTVTDEARCCRVTASWFVDQILRQFRKRKPIRFFERLQFIRYCVALFVGSPGSDSWWRWQLWNNALRYSRKNSWSLCWSVGTFLPSRTVAFRPMSLADYSVVAHCQISIDLFHLFYPCFTFFRFRLLRWEAKYWNFLRARSKSFFG